MKTQNNVPDDILSTLRIKLTAIEKKLGPAEAECDALRYQRDTLLATIALMSEGPPETKCVPVQVGVLGHGRP